MILRNKEINPKVKDVLKIIGATALVAGCIIAPGFVIAANAIVKGIKEDEWKKSQKEWKKYNLSRLRQILKRLRNQKIITIDYVDNEVKITLTKKGKKKVLMYRLEDMMIKRPPRWDNKWRVIIYDIPKKKKILQDSFRRMLKRLEFLKIQNSVYLTPYPCEEEIEFLRQYFDIADNIIYMIVDVLENDIAYKNYFGLD